MGEMGWKLIIHVASTKIFIICVDKSLVIVQGVITFIRRKHRGQYIL